MKGKSTVPGNSVISCQNVSKRFCRDFRRSLLYGCIDSVKDLSGISTEMKAGEILRKGEFLSVNNASFELKPGESMGLIGRNGAGKTTLLKILNGLIKPDAGRVEIRGRVGALIALGAGFNPVLTARENIMVNGSILGLSRKRIKEVFDDIIEFAEIEEFVDSPVQTFSSGMAVRLGFAIAAHMEPDILLIDEVLAVGDLSFRRKCLRFVEGFRERGGASILVTHNLNQILSSCQKAVLLEKGRIVADGPSVEVVNHAIELQFGGGTAKDTETSRIRDIGGKPFAIVSACLRGEDEEYPRSGHDAVAEINVRCEEDASDLTWEAYIWSDDFSRRLLSFQSHDFGISEAVRAGGIYRMRCKIVSLPLSPGRYGLRFAVSVKGELQDAVGYENDYLWSHVRPAELTAGEIRRGAVGDLMWAKCEWQGAVEQNP